MFGRPTSQGNSKPCPLGSACLLNLNIDNCKGGIIWEALLKKQKYASTPGTYTITTNIIVAMETLFGRSTSEGKDKPDLLGVAMLSKSQRHSCKKDTFVEAHFKQASSIRICSYA